MSTRTNGVTCWYCGSDPHEPCEACDEVNPLQRKLDAAGNYIEVRNKQGRRAIAALKGCLDEYEATLDMTAINGRAT